MLNKRLILMAISIVTLAGCGPSAPKAETLTVYAAASLKEAVGEIAARFEAASPGLHVATEFLGSQQLALQIEQGAPADVFMAADETHVAEVVKAGLAKPESVRCFAVNRMVIIAKKESSLTSLHDLVRPGLRLVLAAPAVPAGHYAADILQRAGTAPGFPPDFGKTCLERVVSFELDVRAAASRVALGEADASLVYATDAAILDPAKVDTIAIPDALNVTARYAATPLSGSAHAAKAAAWMTFLEGGEARAILQRRGFGLP